MADFIYNSEGRPQGFRLGSFIYDLDGAALGRVWAERVYRFDGSYVGVLFKNMVADKPSVSKRTLPPHARPENVAPISNIEGRRPIPNEYPDVFHMLKVETVEDEPASLFPMEEELP